LLSAHSHRPSETNPSWGTNARGTKREAQNGEHEYVARAVGILSSQECEAVARDVRRKYLLRAHEEGHELETLRLESQAMRSLPGQKTVLM
jgi:hypothetical protein